MIKALIVDEEIKLTQQMKDMAEQLVIEMKTKFDLVYEFVEAILGFDKYDKKYFENLVQCLKKEENFDQAVKLIICVQMTGHNPLEMIIKLVE